MRAVFVSIFLASAAILFTADVLADDVVRIRLLERESPEAIRLTAGSHPIELFAGDYSTPIARLDVGEHATIEYANGQLVLVANEMRMFAERLFARPAAHGHLVLSLERPARQLTRSYAGELRIEPDGSTLRLINAVDLEEYVAAVVSREYGFDDVEGSRAMAVVARTYALRGRTLGAEYDHVDHVRSQVYEGADRVLPVSREAAEATRGEVLTYGGELIEAVYFASSGGYTANNEDVWGTRPLPYLRAKADPFDSLSPHGSWTSTLTRQQVLNALSRATGYSVSGFISGERGPDGRIRNMELLRTSGPRAEVTANRFRLIIIDAFGAQALRSTNFEVRREGESYVFTGAGYGHGVGMNQWGARYLATNGHSYRDILAYYYTGVTLARHQNGVPTRSGEALAADAVIAAAEGRSVTLPSVSTTDASDGRSDEARQSSRVQRPDRPTSPTRPTVTRPDRRIGW
jgi:stage II sporulation protein D